MKRISIQQLFHYRFGLRILLLLVLAALIAIPSRPDAVQARNNEALAPIAFVHKAPSMVGVNTYINNTATNNKPNALLFVTQNWNPGGVGGKSHPHAVGVVYIASKSQWTIYTPGINMTPNAAFNVLVTQLDGTNFIHMTTDANRIGNITYINHPAINGNLYARILVTANASPNAMGGLSVVRKLGVKYDKVKKQWAIFNQDNSAQVTGTAFNVRVLAGATSFSHRAEVGENTENHSTFINHPLTNNKPNALIFVTQNWNGGGIENNHPVGVWYDNGRKQWAIFNQDNAAFKDGVTFNVEVVGG